MLDYLVRKNSIIDKNAVNKARKASNVDFNEIITHLNEDKKEYHYKRTGPINLTGNGEKIK